MTAPVEFFHGHTNVLQERTRVGGSEGFMGPTRYFSGPMLCSVPRVVGNETAPLNSFMHGHTNETAPLNSFMHGHTNLFHELSRASGT